MAKNLAELKAQLLSTDYPQWRNRFSSGTLFILVTAMVFTWWYLYFTVAGVECYKGFFYLSFLWLLVQWVVIGYLYWYRNIPRFARTTIKMLIAIANSWFGLFIFSLDACIA